MFRHVSFPLDPSNNSWQEKYNFEKIWTIWRPDTTLSCISSQLGLIGLALLGYFCTAGFWILEVHIFWLGNCKLLLTRYMAVWYLPATLAEWIDSQLQCQGLVQQVWCSSLSSHCGLVDGENGHIPSLWPNNPKSPSQLYLSRTVLNGCYLHGTGRLSQLRRHWLSINATLNWHFFAWLCQVKLYTTSILNLHS